MGLLIPLKANNMETPKGKNFLDHDDLNNLISQIIELVQKKFKNFKHDALTDAQEDELWTALEPLLERFSGYPDYRNYN